MAENIEHAPINKEKSEKEVLKRAIHKFNHLKSLVDRPEIAYFSSREKWVTWLDFYSYERDKNDDSIRYRKTMKIDKNQSSELEANLHFDKIQKEFKYNSWEVVLDSKWHYAWKTLAEFPGTKNLQAYEWVIISPEKAIHIMNRMIKEVEAAKKCKPIRKSRELLSELKQDVWDITPEKAA